MLEAILVTNASKRANHVSMVLGWLGADLVVDPPLALPFPFWTLPNFWGFPTLLA
jgi:hypothetical protein